MLITDRIKEFSNQLVKELGIDPIKFSHNDIAGEIQWHTPSFIIYPERRCFPHEWINLLEVMPKSSSCNMCSTKFFDTYNISKYIEDDISWHYKFHETKTENLPSEQFRYTILKELRQCADRETRSYYDWDANCIRKIVFCTNAEVRENILAKKLAKKLAERITSRFEILDL